MFDSLQHAPAAPAELFLVEGDSAAEAVCAVRDPQLQAVFALQGKPVNAMRASPRRVKDSPWLARLTQLLGNAPGTDLPFGELRYIRILLLLDPDADGIHAGALLQMFFLRTMRVLLEQGKIYIVHAPWGEIRRPGQPPLLSYHSAEFQQQCRELNATGDSSAQRIRHRGLGTLTPEVLERTCVNPATRRARALGVQDAELAASVFASELR